MDAVPVSFQVTGTYKSSIPDTNGIWQVQQELPFTIHMRATEWFMRVDFGADWYEHYACNGTNVFYSLQHSNNPAGVMPGAVMEDAYPVNGNPHATILWLAFCSAATLDQGISLPAPWADARRTPLAYLYDMEVDRYAEPPMLPSRIRYVTSVDRKKSAARGKYLLRESLNEQDKYLRSFNYETIAGNGVLGGEYKVTDVTRTNGMVLPARFEMVFYDHLSGKKANNLKAIPRIRYEGRVTNVTSDVKPGSLLPPLDRRVDIVDYRLKDPKPVDFVVYAHTGDSWPEAVTDEMRENLKQRAAFSLPTTLNRAASVRTVFLSLLALAIILPLAIKVVAQRRKQTKTTHK